MDITYTNTGLTERGNAEIASSFEAPAEFARRMEHWQRSMNHYLACSSCR